MSYPFIAAIHQSLSACRMSKQLEASIASSCLSPRLPRQYMCPFLISWSGSIRLFAAAACIPLNLALCVHCSKRLRPYSAARTSLQLAPIRPTTPRSIVVLLSNKVSISTFTARQALFYRAKQALPNPGAHLYALKLALFLSHLSNIHSAVFTA